MTRIDEEVENPQEPDNRAHNCGTISAQDGTEGYCCIYGDIEGDVTQQRIENPTRHNCQRRGGERNAITLDHEFPPHRREKIQLECWTAITSCYVSVCRVAHIFNQRGSCMNSHRKFSGLWYECRGIKFSLFFTRRDFGRRLSLRVTLGHITKSAVKELVD